MSDEEPEEYHIPYMNNEAILYRKGPYGHFFIRLKKGAIPSAFEGAFTTRDAAEKIIKAYEGRKLNGTAGL